MEEMYDRDILRKYYSKLKETTEKTLPFCIDEFLLSQGSQKQYEKLVHNFGIMEPCGTVPLVFGPWDIGEVVE